MIIFFLVILLQNVSCFPVFEDRDVQRYFAERKLLIEFSEYQTIGSDLNLTDAEEKANQILMKYKFSDLTKGFKDPKTFLAAQHFFISKPLIEKSCVYKIIQKLPKGASLHSHTPAMVSYEYFFNNLTYRDNLYALQNAEDKIQLKFFKRVPDDNWKNVSYLRKTDPTFDERLREQTSLVRENPYNPHLDGYEIWQSFEKTFGTFEIVINYKPVFREYFYEVLKELHEDNVKYLEFRGPPLKLYDLDGNETSPEESIKIILETVETFKRDYPDFVGVKLIYSFGRHINVSEFEGDIRDFKQLREKYPSFITGFDLIGQEELGHPLKDFIPQLLDLKNYTNFYFHAGETLWNGLSADQNLFDAVLLNTSRIGHGYAIIKHPEVYRLVKERNIPVEISPISNQVLGLVSDFRNHPGNHLIANNFSVVITNDDPMCWGAKALSFDWYVAFMGLSGKHADLRLLKQLAINSITYSSMSFEEKSVALKQWEKDWDIFINNISSFENCEETDYHKRSF